MMTDKPPVDLEEVSDQDFEGVNFSVAGKRVLRCVFKNCNILVTGAPFHLEGCTFHSCHFAAMGPVADAHTSMSGTQIKRRLKEAFKPFTGDKLGPDNGKGLRFNPYSGN
jgi:hypothetical protein